MNSHLVGSVYGICEIVDVLPENQNLEARLTRIRMKARNSSSSYGRQLRHSRKGWRIQRATQRYRQTLCNRRKLLGPYQSKRVPMTLVFQFSQGLSRSDGDRPEDYGCRLLRRKKYLIFSEGDVNKMIDDAFHPLAKKDLRYWFADGIAHALNEQDPIRSLEKFIHYDAPHIVEQVFKETLGRRRKRR